VFCLNSGVKGRLWREGSRILVYWTPSLFMRKKEELLAFKSDERLRVSPFVPFFKFVNTNGSKLVRCILIDQGFLEVMPERLFGKRKKKKKLKSLFWQQ
jgi:hypothetical protein